jgi:hypothetical protein
MLFNRDTNASRLKARGLEGQEARIHTPGVRTAGTGSDARGAGSLKTAASAASSLRHCARLHAGRGGARSEPGGKAVRRTKQWPSFKSAINHSTPGGMQL